MFIGLVIISLYCLFIWCDYTINGSRRILRHMEVSAYAIMFIAIGVAFFWAKSGQPTMEFGLTPTDVRVVLIFTTLVIVMTLHLRYRHSPNRR